MKKGTRKPFFTVASITGATAGDRNRAIPRDDLGGINMPHQTIIFEKEAGIATLTLNRPEVLNALNQQMTEEMVAAIESAARDETVRVVIINGAGRAFCSGMDVGNLQEIAAGDVPYMETAPGKAILGQASFNTLVMNLRTLAAPVICAIRGAAAGAGLAFALACDIRLAAEDARFSVAFTQRGFIPDMGATYFLPRLVGLGMASKLVFASDTIDAREAARIGLVDEVVPSEELMEKAKELALRIVRNPPLAVKMSKQALNKGMNETDLKSHMEYEIFIQAALQQTEDSKEAVNSFIEKRVPRYRGR